MIKLKRDLGISEVVDFKGKKFMVTLVHVKGYMFTIQEIENDIAAYAPLRRLNNERRSKANTELAYQIIETLFK